MRLAVSFPVTVPFRKAALVLLSGAFGVTAAAAGSGSAYIQQVAPPASSAFVNQLSPSTAPRAQRSVSSSKQTARKSAAKSAPKPQQTAVLELRITDLGAMTDGMPLTLPTVRDGVAIRLNPGTAR